MPGGVLGGITVVLYGMIGLLGAKIWKENGVDFGNPINLVPIAAGIIIGIGGVSLKFTDRLLARAASRSARSSPSSATTWPGRSAADGELREPLRRSTRRRRRHDHRSSGGRPR